MCTSAKLNLHHSGVGVIYSFFLPYGNYGDPIETRIEYLKDSFLKNEQELINSGYSVGTLIVTKSQSQTIPGFVEFIKEHGWEEVASSSNPVHNNQTFCHLFIKEFNPSKKEQYKVLKIKKFDKYKVRKLITSLWKKWKNG